VASEELVHQGAHVVEHTEEHEQVVAPDQLKPAPFPKLTRFLAVFVSAVLVVMALIGNHRGNVEKVFLIAIAAIMVLAVILDFFLKRAGLKNI
jgi:hypothetical protein